MDMEVFFTLHSDLPREGPGSDQATAEALAHLPPLPQSPRIFDLGCGPGRHTRVLARHFRTPIVAVDFHTPYLERLQQAAAEEGLADVIQTRVARMEDLEVDPGSVDLIWIEGAIFVVGFEAGLQSWRPWLRPGGLAVVSEAAWLTEQPPREVRAYWDDAYPAITTIPGNIERASACGYEVFHHFTLPPSAWWDEYYTPLRARVAQLRPEADRDPALAGVLDETEREIAMYERHGDRYGYVFFLMRKHEGA